MNEILIVLNAMTHLLARTSSNATCKRTGGEYVKTVVLRSQKKHKCKTKEKQIFSCDKCNFKTTYSNNLYRHKATCQKEKMDKPKKHEFTHIFMILLNSQVSLF